jgi:UDP-N-acetylmuramoyl-L-alanyl-D-glutamate--2,6-diaminopimelate ligase
VARPLAGLLPDLAPVLLSVLAAGQGLGPGTGQGHAGDEARGLPGLVRGVVARAEQARPGGLLCVMDEYLDYGQWVEGRSRLGRAPLADLAGLIVAAPVPDCPCPQIVVADPRRAAALAARWFHGAPDESLWLVGVTGTNGKTTTAHLVQQILAAAGVRAAALGTLGLYIDGERVEEGEYTTPLAPDLYALLRRLVDQGVQALAMECSSHALALGRCHGLAFDCAILTNLTRDHLDFHGDLASYREAKAGLFRGLPAGATVLLNADDALGAALARELGAVSSTASGAQPSAVSGAVSDTASGAASGAQPSGRIWTYGLGEARPQEEVRLPALGQARGLDGYQAWMAMRLPPLGRGQGQALADPQGQAQIQALGLRLAADGSRFLLTHGRDAAPVHLPLLGAFNVANALAAAGAALAYGVPFPQLSRLLAQVRGVAGRMERVPLPGGRLGVVDFAHTPDALEQVLRALRALGPARILTVFGCGGDRDRGKRPLMGEVAARLSDLVVVTSDNPRTEVPEAIIADILPGISRSGTLGAAISGPGISGPGISGEQPTVEPDRRAAIRAAFAMSQPGDVILVAGKGHEPYQIVGTTKHPFSDRAELEGLVLEGLA